MCAQFFSRNNVSVTLEVHSYPIARKLSVLLRGMRSPNVAMATRKSIRMFIATFGGLIPIYTRCRFKGANYQFRITSNIGT